LFPSVVGSETAQGKWVERSKVKRRKETILVSVVKRGLQLWLSRAVIESKNIRGPGIEKKNELQDVCSCNESPFLLHVNVTFSFHFMPRNPKVMQTAFHTFFFISGPVLTSTQRFTLLERKKKKKPAVCFNELNTIEI